MFFIIRFTMAIIFACIFEWLMFIQAPGESMQSSMSNGGDKGIADPFMTFKNHQNVCIFNKFHRQILISEKLRVQRKKRSGTDEKLHDQTQHKIQLTNKRQYAKTEFNENDSINKNSDWQKTISAEHSNEINTNRERDDAIRTANKDDTLRRLFESGSDTSVNAIGTVESAINREHESSESDGNCTNRTIQRLIALIELKRKNNARKCTNVSNQKRTVSPVQNLVLPISADEEKKRKLLELFGGTSSSSSEANIAESDDFDEKSKGIWKFFAPIPQSHDQAKCKLCHTEIRFIRNGKDSGDLELHLRTDHWKQFKSYIIWCKYMAGNLLFIFNVTGCLHQQKHANGKSKNNGKKES